MELELFTELKDLKTTLKKEARKVVKDLLFASLKN
jgi:hypothetical protein